MVIMGGVHVYLKQQHMHDSLLSRHMQVLRRWIKDEWKNKKKQELDLSQWEDYTPPRCPLQDNGSLNNVVVERH